MVSRSGQAHSLLVGLLTWPFPAVGRRGLVTGSGCPVPRALLGSKGAHGRWLTSSNRTMPFISPPRLAPLALAATVPQSQGERHQTRHQNVPSTVQAMGVGRMHLSPGRFLLGSMGGVRFRAATSLGKASGLKAQGGHHLEVKDSIA